jgi:hypothetical protein
VRYQKNPFAAHESLSLLLPKARLRQQAAFGQLPDKVVTMQLQVAQVKIRTPVEQLFNVLQVEA